jgi:hypothetical protein
MGSREWEIGNGEWGGCMSKIQNRSTERSRRNPKFRLLVLRDGSVLRNLGILTATP